LNKIQISLKFRLNRKRHCAFRAGPPVGPCLSTLRHVTVTSPHRCMSAPPDLLLYNTPPPPFIPLFRAARELPRRRFLPLSMVKADEPPFAFSLQSLGISVIDLFPNLSAQATTAPVHQSVVMLPQLSPSLPALFSEGPGS
jgi:hypothetical protein